MVRRFTNSTYDRRVRRILLAVVGVTAVTRGWVYVGHDVLIPPDYVSALDPVVPIWAYGVVWLLAGIAVLIGIGCPKIARWAMSTVASMCGMWALSYLSAWAFLGIENAWVTATSFVAMAVMVAVFTYLMEPPDEVHVLRGPEA